MKVILFALLKMHIIHHGFALLHDDGDLTVNDNGGRVKSPDAHVQEKELSTPTKDINEESSPTFQNQHREEIPVFVPRSYTQQLNDIFSWLDDESPCYTHRQQTDIASIDDWPHHTDQDLPEIDSWISTIGRRSSPIFTQQPQETVVPAYSTFDQQLAAEFPEWTTTVSSSVPGLHDIDTAWPVYDLRPPRRTRPSWGQWFASCCQHPRRDGEK